MFKQKLVKDEPIDRTEYDLKGITKPFDIDDIYSLYPILLVHFHYFKIIHIRESRLEPTHIVNRSECYFIR